MRNWRIGVIAGMIAVPWLGTLAWMQVTGEAAEAAYEGALLAADGTSMDGSGGGSFGNEENVETENNKFLEKMGENENLDRKNDNEVGVYSDKIDKIFDIVGEEDENSVADGDQMSLISVSSRKILVERQDTKTYMSVEDYLPGVLVCQMPEGIDGVEYDLEAWKCQAVIARTYICRLMEGRSEIYEEELDLDYPGETRSLLESSKDTVVRRLELAGQAVEATQGVVMKYDDRYILPLFHEMSAGRTRQGHADFPYLQSVESSQDVKRSTYLHTMEWTKAEFASRISQIPDAASVTAAQLPQEIQTVEKDDAGYLLRIKIGARTYTGDEVRWTLGLPSACFNLEGDGDLIRARVRGSGHGYGLSQAGADSMAREGWGYQEILQHYYKNISLISE